MIKDLVDKGILSDVIERIELIALSPITSYTIDCPTNDSCVGVFLIGVLDQVIIVSFHKTEISITAICEDNIFRFLDEDKSVNVYDTRQ